MFLMVAVAVVQVNPLVLDMVLEALLATVGKVAAAVAHLTGALRQED